ncbi:MAG: aminotransferase class I/II-fold pyridoxal phosphate-dependent enzyme [Candidatus Obscuribacterales bacterium]|nr:aminotransferase class I/II-fold pyridoxal phosphate-dependent enzyme [Candidatus Obscuribacterales bacterium]
MPNRDIMKAGWESPPDQTSGMDSKRKQRAISYLTHKTSTSLTKGSGTKVPQAQFFSAAIEAHIEQERASFHTPGHKGRTWRQDLTELPGLDTLSSPEGIIANLQERAAELWGAQASYISVNGASAALCGAIIASANRGSSILLPRNVHRSAINAVIISGLNPIWLEPEWDSHWGLWGEVNPKSVKAALEKAEATPAAVVITSPTYAGKLSDIRTIANLCKEYGTLLIVDEAHGTHLAFTEQSQLAALACGADFCAQSFHKTLGAPTQTGLLHLSKDCPVSKAEVQAAMNLLQSSSPSYFFMCGIEHSLNEIEQVTLAKIEKMALNLSQELSKIAGLEIYGQNSTAHQDTLHILVNARGISAETLHEALCRQGIFAEAILGKGILLMLGTGTLQTDCSQLVQAFQEIIAKTPANGKIVPEPKPQFGEQILNPRKAFFMKKRETSARLSDGCIAGDWLAPCPPGMPILVPGQKITGTNIIQSLPDKLNVVVES